MNRANPSTDKEHQATNLRQKFPGSLGFLLWSLLRLQDPNPYDTDPPPGIRADREDGDHLY